MDPIGGYFELELPDYGCYPHYDGIQINSGRHALELLLASRIPRKIYLPSYTCSVILQPLQKLGIPYEFYDINFNLEMTGHVSPGPNEYVVINNYFGIKDEYVYKISRKYTDKVILDNCQAFFCEAPHGVDTFYSPRKFVGVPDGGIALSARHIQQPSYIDVSTDRSAFLLRRIDIGPEAGYSEFRSNSASISQSDLMSMSRFTRRMLRSINYDYVVRRRIENFAILHQSLNRVNELEVPLPDSYACPMVYPLLTNHPGLRERLIENKIYVARYWPGIESWCGPEATALILSDRLIPLPIDQRYGRAEMFRIIDILGL